MHAPTQVEARFGEDGTITVLSFTWQGRRLAVTGTGREWTAADGHHFLVMTTGERVFELTFDPAGHRWQVMLASAPRLSA